MGGDAIAFSPDGTRLGLCDRGELIYLDPRTGKETARAPQKDLRAFAFSADGSRVALATARAVEVVDARSFATLMRLEPTIDLTYGDPERSGELLGLRRQLQTAEHGA